NERGLQCADYCQDQVERYKRVWVECSKHQPADVERDPDGHEDHGPQDKAPGAAELGDPVGTALGVCTMIAPDNVGIGVVNHRLSIIEATLLENADEYISYLCAQLRRRLTV